MEGGNHNYIHGIATKIEVDVEDDVLVTAGGNEAVALCSWERVPFSAANPLLGPEHTPKLLSNIIWFMWTKVFGTLKMDIPPSPAAVASVKCIEK